MGLTTTLWPVHNGTPTGEPADIDKSYFELSEGLDALGLDGNFIVIGARGVGDDSDDDGFYEARLDPDDVRRNWEQLRTVTFERFLAALKETPLGKGNDSPGNDEYLEHHFATLADVYRRAADAGAGMKISAS